MLLMVFLPLWAAPGEPGILVFDNFANGATGSLNIALWNNFTNVEISYPLCHQVTITNNYWFPKYRCFGQNAAAIGEVKICSKNDVA